jgi:hypothetical protein
MGVAVQLRADAARGRFLQVSAREESIHWHVEKGNKFNTWREKARLNAFLSTRSPTAHAAFPANASHHRGSAQQHTSAPLPQGSPVGCSRPYQLLIFVPWHRRPVASQVAKQKNAHTRRLSAGLGKRQGCRPQRRARGAPSAASCWPCGWNLTTRQTLGVRQCTTTSTSRGQRGLPEKVGPPLSACRNPPAGAHADEQACVSVCVCVCGCV